MVKRTSRFCGCHKENNETILRLKVRVINFRKLQLREFCRQIITPKFLGHTYLDNIHQVISAFVMLEKSFKPINEVFHSHTTKISNLIKTIPYQYHTRQKHTATFT
mgnify:CR=1 FL=1